MKLPILLALVFAGASSSLRAQAPLAMATLYVPPACSVAPYSDVSSGHPACPWIKQLKVDQVTAGCAPGAFCPDQPVTRAQMAILLERAMRGTASWDPASAIFKRILIVSPVPDDPEASGSRLLAVVGSITGSTATNSYLVLIEPGSYHLGNTQLVMPPFVTLLGAGLERTEIHVNYSGPGIVGAEDTVIDSLRVSNDGSGTQVVAIDLPSASSGTLRNVFAKASGGLVSIGARCGASCTIEDSQITGFGTNTSIGVYIYDDTTTATLRRVWARGLFGAHAYGLSVSGARVTVEGGKAEALLGDNNWALTVAGGSRTVVRDLVAFAESNSAGATSAGGRVQSDGVLTVENSRLESDDFAGTRYGLICFGGEASVHNSRLIGANASVYGHAGCSIDIAATQLSGAAVDPNGGTVRCALAYSENLNVPATTGCF